MTATTNDLVPSDYAAGFGVFDFGLTSEQEKRARRVHDEAIVCDMLFQGICTHRAFTPEMNAELKRVHESSGDMHKTRAATFAQPLNWALQGRFDMEAIWKATGITCGSMSFEYALDGRESFIHAVGRATPHFEAFPFQTKVLCAEDVRRAKREGKHGRYLNSQLTDGNLLDVLESLYMAGSRQIQLTYNYMCAVGSGCTERTDAGVSSYGAKCIARMNELGIIVDTAHCGRQTTLDAAALSSKPIIASHTASENVYMHARAKSDEELRAIADCDGVIGVYAVNCFLGPNGGDGLTVEVMLDNIDYIADKVGWQHVGIGTDWPLNQPKWVAAFLQEIAITQLGFRPEDNINTVNTLEGFDDYRDFPNLTRGMVKRGYTDEQIKGILGENFLRVFEAVNG